MDSNRQPQCYEFSANKLRLIEKRLGCVPFAGSLLDKIVKTCKKHKNVSNRLNSFHGVLHRIRNFAETMFNEKNAELIEAL